MTVDRYTRGAILLHWTIAILLLFQLGVGWRMTSRPPGDAVYAAYQLHKSIGIVILALTAARVAIRLITPQPPSAATGGGRLIVRYVHLGLYLFMIGAPLTGWALVSTAQPTIPTRLFGVLDWPHLPLPRAWHGPFSAGHMILAWSGAGLILLHFAGAVRHHLGRRPRIDVIGRMIPVVGARPAWAIPAATVAAMLLAICFLVPWYAGGRSAIESRPAPSVAPWWRARAMTSAAAARNDNGTIAQKRGGEPAELVADSPVVANVSTAWQLRPGGRLGFVARMGDSTIEGRFRRWAADVTFDPRNPAKGRIAAEIFLPSATTDDAERDAMLGGPSFLGVAGATATYRSEGFESAGGDRYRTRGMLTLNRISRPVMLTFALRITGDEARVSGTTSLDRTTFGIGTGDWSDTAQIAGAVDVRFDFKATRSTGRNAVGKEE